jgi:hypothetical protein
MFMRVYRAFRAVERMDIAQAVLKLMIIHFRNNI